LQRWWSRLRFGANPHQQWPKQSAGLRIRFSSYEGWWNCASAVTQLRLRHAEATLQALSLAAKLHDAVVVQTIADGVMRGNIAPSDNAIENASKKLSERSKLFCIRSNWTGGYVQAVVVQYGREHPKLLDEPAAEQMLKIMAKAFPCTGTK
jgi:hypothetical protein